MAAVYEWVDFTNEWGLESSNGNLVIGRHIPIEAPWSIQRLLIFGGMHYVSNAAGTLVGNPLFTQYRGSFHIYVTRPGGDRYPALARWTTVAPVTEANVTPTSAHRTTTWNWPFEFFSFDADVRQAGGTQTAVDTSIVLQNASTSTEAMLCEQVSGTIVTRVLLSKPFPG